MVFQSMSKALALICIPVAFFCLAFAAHANPNECGSPTMWQNISLLARRLTDGPCLNCTGVAQACDLKKIEPLPEVVFVAEDSHRASETEVLRLELIDKALKGQIVLASEVSANSSYLDAEKAKKEKLGAQQTSASLLHGIESPVPWSLAVSYTVQNSVLEKVGNGPEKVRALIYMLAENSLADQAFQKIKKNLPPKLAKKTEAVVKKTSEDLAAQRASKDLGLNFSQEELQTLSNELHASMIQLANEKYQSDLLGEPLPILKSAEDAAQIGFKDGRMQEGSLMWKIKVDLRDRDMSGKVIDLLCEQSGKREKIFVDVGNGHVEGMEKILTHLSGGRLKMQAFDVSDKKSREEIRNMLSP